MDSSGCHFLSYLGMGLVTLFRKTAMFPFLVSAMGKFSQTCASRVLTVCAEVVL